MISTVKRPVRGKNVTVRFTDTGISISIEGYGQHGEGEETAHQVFVDLQRLDFASHPQVLVYSDITNDAPEHVIPLGRARVELAHRDPHLGCTCAYCGETICWNEGVSSPIGSVHQSCEEEWAAEQEEEYLDT